MKDAPARRRRVAPPVHGQTRHRPLRLEPRTQNSQPQTPLHSYHSQTLARAASPPAPRVSGETPCPLRGTVPTHSGTPALLTQPAFLFHLRQAQEARRVEPKLRRVRRYENTLRRDVLRYQ